MDKAKPIWTVVASWFAPGGSDVDLAHAVTPPNADDEAERAGDADYDPYAARAWTVQHDGSGRWGLE